MCQIKGDGGKTDLDDLALAFLFVITQRLHSNQGSFWSWLVWSRKIMSQTQQCQCRVRPVEKGLRRAAEPGSRPPSCACCPFSTFFVHAQPFLGFWGDWTQDCSPVPNPTHAQVPTQNCVASACSQHTLSCFPSSSLLVVLSAVPMLCK